ncbi:hypothetical protein HK104_003799, partial [Borealophlyctis nickersoniae]
MPINWLGSRSNLNLERVNSPSTPHLPQPVDPDPKTPLGAFPPLDFTANRRVWINTPPQRPYIDERTGRPTVTYKGNKIHTSKYTVLTFLPKNLFEQFRSVANFYFTSLVVLQAFPPFAQVSIVVTAAPIVFIVAVTAVKDAFEDLKRHRSDNDVNNTATYLLSDWENTNHVAESGWKFAMAQTFDKIGDFFSDCMLGFLIFLRDLLVPKRKKKRKEAKGPPKPEVISAADYVNDGGGGGGPSNYNGSIMTGYGRAIPMNGQLSAEASEF